MIGAGLRETIVCVVRASYWTMTDSVNMAHINRLLRTPSGSIVQDIDDIVRDIDAGLKLKIACFPTPPLFYAPTRVAGGSRQNL